MSQFELSRPPYGLGSYGVLRSNFRSTYLRAGAVEALGGTPENASMAVAYAPGVAVFLPAGEGCTGGMVYQAGAPKRGALTDLSPREILSRARDAIDEAVPRPAKPPGEAGPLQAEPVRVNGKGALRPGPAAREWLGAWAPGAEFETRMGVDEEGVPYLMLRAAAAQAPAGEVTMPVQVVLRKYRCTCGGFVQKAGRTGSAPGTYLHRCAACSAETDLPRQYPYYDYVGGVD